MLCTSSPFGLRWLKPIAIMCTGLQQLPKPSELPFDFPKRRSSSEQFISSKFKTSVISITIQLLFSVQCCLAPIKMMTTPIKPGPHFLLHGTGITWRGIPHAYSQFLSPVITGT